MRLAHISDPHFGSHDPAVSQALREDLLAQAPDLVVLTGDITQRARSAQFRAARDFIDSLAPLPVLALPGNHDQPIFDLVTRFATPYKLYRRHIGEDLAPSWKNGELAVLGVNSTRLLRHKHGTLPEALVSQVAQRLTRLPQRFKIVALHHPLAVVEESDLRNRPRGADMALSAWAGAGADLILGGHIHLPYCVPAGPAYRRTIVLQAGTAVSTRLRGGYPNSYGLVRFPRDGRRCMDIEQRDYDRRTGRFAPSLAWRATCDDTGWSLSSRPPDEAA